MTKPKILFICKQRPSIYGASYGLLNSCRFLCNALNELGTESKLVEVVDNNRIDREVNKFKPTHVFIEALWVVPEKFEILIPLHSKVQWHVRLHSNTPFIANEGVAMEWIKKYALLQKKYSQFHISPNSYRMMTDLQSSLGIQMIYSPNVYQPDLKPEIEKNIMPGVIQIGCFGAIRPLKNQLIQAMAAISFAENLGKILHFHMNNSRLEQNGDNVYKNLTALFDGSKHKLITHEWMSHEDFLKLIGQMDLGLQVSFSETFNIVAADFTHMNVPLIGSGEIDWLSSLYKSDTTYIDDIISHLWLAWYGKLVNLQYLNNWGLNRYNSNSKKVWKKYLKL
jgi:hypothetical protein